MKKIFGFMALALAFIGVSCNLEKSEIEGIEKVSSVTITAGIEGEEARTVLEEGFKVLWSGKEQFKVLTTNAQTATFTANVTEPSATAVFTTTTEGFTGEEYLAHYPASVSATMDLENKTVSTLISNNQKPVAGSMDPTAAPMVAYAATTNFSFKNTVALAKFTVKEEGVTDVQLVADDALAGNYTYDVEAQSATISNSNVSKTIQVMPATGSTFVKDQSYYVAIIPGEKTNLKLVVNGVTTKEVASFEFKRNKIYNLGTVAPFVAEATNWSLVGAFNEWGATPDLPFYTTQTANLYVVKDVELTAYSEWKIRKDNAWTKTFGGGHKYYEPNKYTTIYDNGSNMSVTLNGTYDIYFEYSGSGNQAKMYIVTAGEDYKTAVAQSKEGPKPNPTNVTFGIVGNHNGWGNDNIMTLDETLGVYVAKNIALNGAFKIRGNKDWNSGYNIGAGSTSKVTVGKGITVQNSGSSGNLTVTAGTYDVYYSYGKDMLWVMNVGNVPTDL